VHGAAAPGQRNGPCGKAGQLRSCRGRSSASGAVPAPHDFEGRRRSAMEFASRRGGRGRARSRTDRAPRDTLRYLRGDGDFSERWSRDSQNMGRPVRHSGADDPLPIQRVRGEDGLRRAPAQPLARAVHNDCGPAARRQSGGSHQQRQKAWPESERPPAPHRQQTVSRRCTRSTFAQRVVTTGAHTISLGLIGQAVTSLKSSS
jgi:hypothetical protein